MEEKTFPEIKQKLIDDVEEIKRYIVEGNATREKLIKDIAKLHLKIYGDDEATPPINGLEDRLTRLEVIEQDRVKIRDAMLKTAVGSVTIAVGSIVIWVFQVLKEAFTKGH